MSKLNSVSVGWNDYIRCLMRKTSFVYIMANKHRNVLYIGVTADLKARVYQHRNHEIQASFTDRYNIEHLIYYELFDQIEQAILREKQLKRWSRVKKNKVIEQKNPNLLDLYDEIMADVYSLLD